MSLQDAILQKAKLKRKTIRVEDWEADVQIRELSGLERCEFLDRWRDMTGEDMAGDDLPEDSQAGKPKPVFDMAGKYQLMLEIVSKVAEEPGQDGVPLFTEEGVKKLFEEASYAPIERLFFEVMELSGMASSSIEEAEKNSPETQPGSGILS